MNHKTLTSLPSVVNDTLIHSRIISDIKNRKTLNLNKYKKLSEKLPEKLQRIDKTLPNPPLPESLKANKDLYEYLEEVMFDGYLYRSGEAFDFITRSESPEENINTLSGKIHALYKYTIRAKNKISVEYLISLGLGNNNKLEHIFYLNDFATVHQKSAEFVDEISKPKKVKKIIYGDDIYKKAYKTDDKVFFLEPAANNLVEGTISKLYKSPFDGDDEIVICFEQAVKKYQSSYLIKYFFEEIPELLDTKVILRNELKPGVRLYLENQETFTEIIVDSFYRKGSGTFMVRYTAVNDPNSFVLTDFTTFRKKARKKAEKMSVNNITYTAREQIQMLFNNEKNEVTFIGKFLPFFEDNLSPPLAAVQTKQGRVYTMSPEVFHKSVMELEQAIEYELALSKVPANLLFVDFISYTAKKDCFEQKKFNFNGTFNRSRFKSFITPFGKLHISQVQEKGQDNALIISNRGINLNLTDTNSDALADIAADIFRHNIINTDDKVFKQVSGTLPVLDDISVAVNAAHKEIAKYMQKNCGDNVKAIYSNLFYKGGDRVYYHQAGNILLVNISNSGLKARSTPEENDNGATNGIFPPEKLNSGQPGLFEMPVAEGDKLVMFSDDFLNNLRSGVFRGLPLNYFCKKVAGLQGEQLIELPLLIHKLNNLVMERNRKEEFKYPLSFAAEALKAVTNFLTEYFKLDYPEQGLTETENGLKKHKTFNYFCEMYYHYRTNKDYKDIAGEIIAGSEFMNILKSLFTRELDNIGEKALEKINSINEALAEKAELLNKSADSVLKTKEETITEIAALEYNKASLLENHRELVNKASVLAVEMLRLLQNFSQPEALACFYELLKYQLESGNIKYTVKRYAKLAEQIKSGGLHISTAWIEDPETRSEQKLQLSGMEIELYNKILTKKDDLTVIVFEIERTAISGYEVYNIRQKDEIIRKYMSGELKPKIENSSIPAEKLEIKETVITDPGELDGQGFYDYRKTYF